MQLIPQTWTWNRTAAPVAWLANGPATTPAVWQARLPADDSTRSRLFSLLSTDEGARWRRLQHRPDQLRFLAGRGLLRLLAGAQLNIPPEQIEFRLGPFGKPALKNLSGPPPLRFNVTHSGDLVLVAFSVAREVGVDLEQVKPMDDLDLTARRVFSEAALHQWLRLNPSERQAAFYQRWTQHEATVKALGQRLPDGPAAETPGLFSCELKLPESYRGTVAWLG